MTEDEQIYYFAFIKKRQLKTLCSAAALKTAPANKKNKISYYDRLALQAILAGEYTSYHYMVHQVCTTLASFEHYFCPSHNFAATEPSAPCLVACYNYNTVKQVASWKTECLHHISAQLYEAEISGTAHRLLLNEAGEVFDFLTEIGTLLNTPAYYLVIITAATRLRFNRYIPLTVT